MSTLSEYKFIQTDPEEIIVWITSKYEEVMGVTVKPASPEQQFIRWMAAAIIQERMLTNYAANQNIPSRAEGKNLDALAELFCLEERPQSKAAACTVRFTISEPQKFAVLIPKGTRVTDTSQTLVWETLEDVYVNAGENYADTKVQCQSAGKQGNGYVPGQIDSIIDTFAYFLSCENLTESDGGMDAATDEEFYNLLRLSMDGYSCAGSIGGYVYYAKAVSTEIADVVPNSPFPGEVYIYVLMKDGNPANEEIKSAVFDKCSISEVRPFTDFVHMGNPEVVPYNIDFTYYIADNAMIGSEDIQEAVKKAVQEFVTWQCERLGRDINPSKLHHLLMQTGIKRAEIREPTFTSLRDGKFMLGLTCTDFTATIPQVAKIGNINILSGGYEDE